MDMLAVISCTECIMSLTPEYKHYVIDYGKADTKKWRGYWFIHAIGIGPSLTFHADNQNLVQN